MIYAYKNIDLEIKDVDKKEGIVSGYFAAFGMKDSDGDIIHPGAFARSIAEWGPEAKGRIKHLQNHDPSKPLGKILELKEDSYGLFYRSKIGKHGLGLDFLKMVESDLIKEHSIGFNDLTPNDKRKGEGANNITDVKLYEGSSLTGWGANEFTPLVAVKGDADKLSDRLKAFEKFVRETDATDETIENCLIYIKQLGQVIENLNITQSAGAVEQKKEEVKPDYSLITKNTINSWIISRMC